MKTIGVRADAESLDAVERVGEVRGGVVAAAQRRVAREQVRVAHVHDHAPSRRILAELHGAAPMRFSLGWATTFVIRSVEPLRGLSG